MMTVHQITAFTLALALATPAVAGAADRIVIDGSTGVMPLVAALAKSYQAGRPDLVIELGRGLGPKDRIKAVADGRIDVALASHGLSPADLTRHGLVAHEVAKVAVVFAVNARVPIGDLTDWQVCAVYATKILNWQELGGPTLGIAPRARPETEVDTEVVRARVDCLRDLKLPEAVRVMPKSGDMARELAATPGAVGFTTMTVVEQSQGQIRPVSLNGVAPTPENVRARVYTLTRDSLVITRAAPSTVARFLDFIRSPRGEEVIAANGAIPAR